MPGPMRDRDRLFAKQALRRAWKEPCGIPLVAGVLHIDYAYEGPRLRMRDRVLTVIHEGGESTELYRGRGSIAPEWIITTLIRIGVVRLERELISFPREGASSVALVAGKKTS